mgnify:CR=1 FL=1
MAIKGYLVNNIVHQEVDFFKSQKEAWVKAFKKLGISPVTTNGIAPRSDKVIQLKATITNPSVA